MPNMLTKTVVNGERVAAVFPCIGGAFNDDEVEATVVTTDDLPKPTFSVLRVAPHRETRMKTFSTLPAALRYARQSQGWG